MSFKTRTVIEFDNHHIKIAQSLSSAANPARVIIENKNISDEELIGKLLALHQDKRFNFQETQIIVSISRHFVFFRHLDLPSQSSKQINSMVELLSANSTPFSREETMIDFIPLNKTQDGYTKVCVVIVPLETITRFINILQKSKLTPHQVSLSSLGLWYWYKDYKSSSFETTLLIDRDPYKTEFCVLDSTGLITSRYIETQSNADLLNQIKLTLDSYAKDNLGSSVKHIAIASTQEMGGDFKTYMQETYGVEIHMIKVEKAEQGVSLNSMEGLLRTKENILVDLRPSSIKSSHHRTISNPQWIRLALLGFLAVISIVVCLNLNFIQDALLLRKLEVLVNQSQTEAAQAKQKIRQFEKLQLMINNRLIVADFINEIYTSLPKSIVLTSLALKDHVLTLEGFASKESDPTDMQAMFVNNRYFENINLEHVNKQETQEGQLSEFKMSCRVKKE